jgi:hypothetical protein
MAQLFDRRCTLVVGKAPPDNFVQVVPDALKITGLRVQFKITKSDRREANNSSIVVYNLNEHSRSMLEGKGVRCILSAGYEGTEAQIFSGDARLIDHRHENGVDWITKFHIGDGERALTFSNVNESFSPGAAAKDIVARLIKAIGLDSGNALQKAKELTGAYARGYVACGRASDELERVLEPEGYTYSIQDGRIEILGPGQTLEDVGPLISPETGLVGSPEWSTPDKKTGKRHLKVKSLLQPRIRPGQRFPVKSAKHNGFLKAHVVEFEGDTAEGPWYTNIEATPTE